MKIENNFKQEKEKLTKIANSFNQEEYDYYLSLTNQQKYETICQELILNQTAQQIPLRFRVHISQLPLQLKQNIIQKLQIYDQDPTDQESVKFRQYVESMLKLPLNVYQNLDNSYINRINNNNNNNYINQISNELKQYLQNVFLYNKQKNQDINPTEKKKYNNENNTVPMYIEDIMQQMVKKHNKRPYPFKRNVKKLKKRKLEIEHLIPDQIQKSRKTDNEQEQKQTIINVDRARSAGPYTLRPFQNLIKQLNQEQQREDSSKNTDETWEDSQINLDQKSETEYSKYELSGTDLLLSEKRLQENLGGRQEYQEQEKTLCQKNIEKERKKQQSKFRVKLRRGESSPDQDSQTFIINEEDLQEFIYNQIDEEQINAKVKDGEKMNKKGILKLNQEQMEKAEVAMYKKNIQEEKNKKKKKKNKNIYENNSKILKKISDQLNKEIYEQQQAKQQLLQIMAKWLRSPESSGITIGLQSPPGCGKTALVKNGLACALDRPVEFINLGGMKDLSVLKGHSYCYVGSTYGLVSQALIKSRCMNPIIVFDELDKLDETQSQIPQFLMHITDPTQNQQFIDDYFHDISIDLSKCLFIFTYNDSKKINKILYDRIHEVRMQGYDNKQKIRILQNFSVPRLLKNYQFEKDQIQFNQETLNYLVQNYSKNEGVRKLEHNIEQIIANINLQYYINNNENKEENQSVDQRDSNFKQKIVTTKMIDKILKNQKNDNLSWKMMYI